MTSAMQVHMGAMLRFMKYVDDTRDRGLVPNPMQKWDGSINHEFIISRRSDSDYAKNTQTRKSISGYMVLLEGAPVMFNSLTAVGPYMAHRFSWALFKLKNFSNFCLFATFDRSKCSLGLQLE
jgi:hypothetical protein